jgi:hypothetical protein
MADYVTFTTAGQLFGLPIKYVQDVFALGNITRVPLAGPKIAGVLNLRGRIVTVIDLANRLQLDAPRDTTAAMVIGIERGTESFGILVDRVGEVLSLAGSTRRFLSRLMPIGYWISVVRDRWPRNRTGKRRNVLSSRPERADKVRTI